MCAFAKESDAQEFIIGTECGILHRLEKENPTKRFYCAGSNIVCQDMKKITLEKLRDCLAGMKEEVVVPEEIAVKAKRAIDAMLALS